MLPSARSGTGCHRAADNDTLEFPMQRYGFLFAFVLVVLAGRVEAGGEKNVTFTSQEGKFSVAMPGQPTKQTQKTPSEIGELNVNLFIVDQKDKGFIASFVDYPRGTVTDQSREKMLDGCRDGNVRGTKGKLQSEKRITQGEKKIPGRELVISLQDGKALYRARIFLVGDRLYQVIAIGNPEFAQSAAVNAYLNSFKVLE
jgi:hypothetical protein